MINTETTKTFADRLQDLIVESGKQVKEIGADIGVSAGALSKYQNDAAEPGINALIKIAKYFNVTSDYLIGLTNNKTAENAEIGKVTGLSDKAILTLSNINSPIFIEIINYLIEQEGTHSITIDEITEKGYASYVNDVKVDSSYTLINAIEYENPNSIIRKIVTYFLVNGNNKQVFIDDNGNIKQYNKCGKPGEHFLNMDTNTLIENVSLIDIQQSLITEKRKYREFIIKKEGLPNGERN